MQGGCRRQTHLRPQRAVPADSNARAQGCSASPVGGIRSSAPLLPSTSSSAGAGGFPARWGCGGGPPTGSAASQASAQASAAACWPGLEPLSLPPPPPAVPAVPEVLPPAASSSASSRCGWGPCLPCGRRRCCRGSWGLSTVSGCCTSQPGQGVSCRLIPSLLSAGWRKEGSREEAGG